MASSSPASSPAPLELLRNLHLRKIVKENHGAAIEAVAFCPDASSRNLLATCGGSTVSIYDNNHCGGGHLDLALCMVNERTAFSAGGAVTQVEWLHSEGLFRLGDALLCFAGESGEIGVVSVASSRVVDVLTGHAGGIVELRAHPRERGWLLSLGSDGTLRVWNAAAGFDADGPTVEPARGPYCAAVFDLAGATPALRGASALAVAPDGASVAVAFGAAGRVALLCLDVAALRGRQAEAARAEPCEVLRELATGGRATVDCLAFSRAGRLVAHDCSGKVVEWDTASGARLCEAAVPGAGQDAKSARSRTRFGLSDCGRFFCCGNASGAVLVLDLDDKASRVADLSMPRVKSFVTAAAFASGNRSVALSTADALLWRWDYAVVDAAARPALRLVVSGPDEEDEQDEEDGY
jgi:WD40 repeat protein